jgi:trehalose-phosphatase
MTSPVQKLLAKLTNAYRHGTQLAFLFDYDGTLVPIVEHPSWAVMPPQTRDVLRHLAKRPRIFLGIISGRKLEELRALVAIENIYYAGTTGLEIDLRGNTILHPRIQEFIPILAELKMQLDTLAKDYHGVWLEDKKFGCTVHYRELDPRYDEELQSRIAKVAVSFREKLRFIGGPRAVEIIPHLGWSKSTAVKIILDDLGSGHLVPFYAGDGENDEEALELVAAVEGFSVAVGNRASPHAHYHIPTPADLIAMLMMFEKNTEKGSTARV